MYKLSRITLFGVMAITASSLAYADTVGSTTVDATANVYSSANPGAGTAATAIAVTAGGTLTFTSITGAITLNGGGNVNNADGIGSASTSSNNPFGSLSGISAPNAGYLAGVFVPAGGPTGTAPASLDFTGTGGTSFSSLSPALDQVFFIGDGLTGNGSGSTQTFYIPSGAGTLYLGIADACGYHGDATGCYTDNSGTFSVSYDIAAASTSPVPEPSSLLLFGTGVVGIAGAVRRRLQA